MKVAVIGGGPAGLVTLKYLVKAHEFFPIEPIEARLFEAGDEIGGTFVQRIYEDAQMVSSKYLTAFSDFRISENAPDFLTPAQYVTYLHGYIKEFGLESFIECGVSVRSVDRASNGISHIIRISTSSGREFVWECDAVVICTGLNMNPNIPSIPGIKGIPMVLHSSQLKTRQQFGRDTHVVILGAGETAMDLAHLAITSPTASVTLCCRDGFFCAPKIIPIPVGKNKSLPSRPNKPVDTSVASLFDTAYAHPILQKSPLLWLAYDQWVKHMHWLISGTQEGPDQWVGQMSKERKHLDSVFLVKSDRALPFLSEGHRSTSWWNRVRSAMLNVPIQGTNGRRIDLASWPSHIDGKGIMHFNNPKSNLRPDVVVFATGYKTDFSFLDKSYPRLRDANVRGIYNEDNVTVGFIGFVRPSIGAIPPLAEMQAQLWVLRLMQHKFPQKIPLHQYPNSLSPYELDYKLRPRAGYDLFTNKHAVDHESYAYQLALDIGAAPTVTHVLSKGWRVFFTWAMGSNFNSKFRLVGPWKWEHGAEQVMRHELFDIVKQSGGLPYFLTYTILPFFVFGVCSICLHFVSGFSSLTSKAMILVTPKRYVKIK